MRRGGLQKICTSLCTIACFLNQRLWSYSRKSFLGKSPIVFYIVNGLGPKEPKEGAISGQNAFSNCCLYWSHPFCADLINGLIFTLFIIIIRTPPTHPCTVFCFFKGTVEKTLVSSFDINGDGNDVDDDWDFEDC